MLGAETAVSAPTVFVVAYLAEIPFCCLQDPVQSSQSLTSPSEYLMKNNFSRHINEKKDRLSVVKSLSFCPKKSVFFECKVKWKFVYIKHGKIYLMGFDRFDEAKKENGNKVHYNSMLILKGEKTLDTKTTCLHGMLVAIGSLGLIVSCHAG